ncbi:MAG: flagellar hook-length control protein FliK, partial [Vibrio sp.]
LNKEMAADQLAERVQMMLSKNLKNIDIRLDPPEMGRMHIRMNMQGDSATVHFTVANQHARDALEQTMPRLREMLAQQGVQLGDTFVQQQSAGQQQRYSGQEQSGFGQSARNGKHNSEENLDTDVKLDLNVATKRDGISYYA